MRVAVIGAGIVGVTSAYELTAAGHEVTVFERRGSVAAEGSFANAGVISPANVVAWGTPPTTRWQLLKLRTAQAPLTARTLGWWWQRWRHSHPELHATQRGALLSLAQHSQQRLQALSQDLKFDYERGEGQLVLLREREDMQRVEAAVACLNDAGVQHQMLDAAQCRDIEPGLSTDTPLAGGVWLAQAEVANCRQFALLLRDAAERNGAKFRFHTAVERLHPGPTPRLTTVLAPQQESTWLTADLPRLEGKAAQGPPAAQPQDESFDAVVVCAALDSPALLRPHGVKLPLTPVYGYSVTAPLRQLDEHPDLGPRASVVDQHHQVTISRIGNRVRVAGGHELMGHPHRHDTSIIEHLYQVLHEWFPSSAHMSQAQTWKGARVTLPDGAPLLGASGLPGVWLNLAHGGQGWALASGSAHVLADLLSARTPSVNLEGFGLNRLIR